MNSSFWIAARIITKQITHDLGISEKAAKFIALG